MSDPTQPYDFSQMSKEQLEGLLRQVDLPEDVKAKAADELTKRLRDELLQDTQENTSLSLKTAPSSPPQSGQGQSLTPAQATASQGGCIVVALAIAGVLLAAFFLSNQTKYGNKCITYVGTCYVNSSPVGGSCTCLNNYTKRLDTGTVR